MSEENFLQEMIRVNREARKGFGFIATVLWDIVTIAYIIVLLAFIALATVNPLWFRSNFIHWSQYKLPGKLNTIRQFMFKRQLDKARFFDTLKNA